MDNQSVRIVLLETNSESIPVIKDFYTRLFSEFSYSVSFKEISRSPKNYDGNKSIFRNEVVDLFITDLSLGSDSKENYDGLDIVKQIKTNYPDLLVIATSAKNVNYLDTADRTPSFDLFVHKRKMVDDDYYRYIKSRLIKIFRKNVFLTVDYENSNLIPKYEQPPKRVELENILRSMTFASIYSSDRTSVRRAVLKKIEGGMSKSEVYRLIGYTINDLRAVDVIVKLSAKGDAQKEINNYFQYVKWYLPYRWRPEVLSTAFWNNTGGICYSNAYNDEMHTESLTHYIKLKDIDNLNKVIRSIFNPKYRTWYHPSNVKSKDNITKYYHKKWMSGRTRPDSQIQSILSGFAGNRIQQVPNNNYYVIDGEKFPDPGVFLGNPRGEFMTCICHGDMSSNNILISEDEITFIDFQDTGIGHIFEDFISIELSLRLYFKTDMDFFDLLNYEKSLIGPTLMSENASAIDPEFQLSEPVKSIRKAAFDNFFPSQEFKKNQITNYLYGLAMSTYGMLRKEKLTDWQKHQLLAVTLAATWHLSNYK